MPLETRLIKYLRIWQEDRQAVTGRGEPVEQELALTLAWFIDDCLAYAPANLGGWWSDGVEQLQIEQTAPNSFKLLGVTWIDCHGIAPFEIDVELNPDDGDRFTRTIFRIGTLNDRGEPTLFETRQHPFSVLQQRPHQNCDWALAVELTPPATEEP